MLLRVVFACLVSVFMALPAAVFQYQVPVSFQHKGKERQSEALLWVPPESAQVRGLLICGHTSAEGDVVRDAIIRAACADYHLALLYVKTSLGRIAVPDLLVEFAELSGYHELAHAPFFVFGHSAGGNPALQTGIRHADRCLGTIQFRGGMPTASAALPAGIPGLAFLAQFDEYWGEQRRQDGYESWQRAQDDFFASFRAADPANIGTFMVEPGGGHFPWTNRNAKFMALWIRKVAAARLPTQWDGASPAQLNLLSHEDGWLTSFDLTAPITCTDWASYPDDRQRTSWHIDEEMARASVAYHEGIYGLKDQFIRWSDAVWVDAGARHFFTNPKWVDADVWQVHPQFRSVVPGLYNGQGPIWLGGGEKSAGNNGAAIFVRPSHGPVQSIGPQQLQLSFDNVYSDFKSKIVWVAYAPAGGGYRATQQVGMMARGFRGLRMGAAQTITFPELPEHISATGEPIPLQATSDSGLPVRYFVDVGPAVIEDGHLVLRDVPLRLQTPLHIEVVAYQMGSAVEPLVKTATPVRRRLLVMPNS